jgi:hypothetical protein
VFNVGPSTLFYTQGALSPFAGLPFKFQVQAVNYQGLSPASPSVRILAAEVPNAPTVPLLVESQKTFIEIRWPAATYNGGVPISSYFVYARANADPFVLVATHFNMTYLSYKQVVPAPNIGVTY